MDISYFIVDSDTSLQRTASEVVEGLWKKQVRTDELDYDVSDDFRLISVLCDENLLPIICYFARLTIHDGIITDNSKIEAFEAMSDRKKNRNDSPAAHWQLAGWPRNWQHQLAVALDVPANQLTKIGLGGPLLMSELWGVPLETVIRYFEEAHEE